MGNIDLSPKGVVSAEYDNMTGAFSTKIIQQCIALRIPVALENPRRLACSGSLAISRVSA